MKRHFELEIESGKSIEIEIEQETVGDVAGVVWDSALVACKYFEKQNLLNPGCYREKVILELGAGTGVCGMVLAALGAHVYATDLEEHLPLLNKNKELNKNELGERMIISALKWGADSLPFEMDFDLILLVDCLYYEESLDSLLKTLLLSCTVKTRIICIYERRDLGKPKWVQDEFFRLARIHFKIMEIAPNDLHPEYQSTDIPTVMLQKK